MITTALALVVLGLALIVHGLWGVMQSLRVYYERKASKSPTSKARTDPSPPSPRPTSS